MPENVTRERTELLRMYGAEIVYSEGAKGSNGAVELALDMAEKDASYYMPYQYGNQANPLAHYNGTALEILEELDEVAAFVAGLGTGGTLMGNGRRLKEELGDQVKIVAAEPMQGEPVQGLRSLEDGFIPPIIDLSLLDRKIFVTNSDAIVFTRRLLDEEGLFVGSPRGRSPASRCGSPASSTRATSCSWSPTTAGSTSRRASTRGRWRRSRTWTPPSGGDRGPAEADASSRRGLLPLRARASPAPAGGGCGGRSLQARRCTTRQPVLEHRRRRCSTSCSTSSTWAIAAYTAGTPLLPPATVKAGKLFLNDELAARRRAGRADPGGRRQADQAARRATTSATRATSQEVLALLHEVERAQISAYLEAIPRLSPALVKRRWPRSWPTTRSTSPWCGPRWGRPRSRRRS